MADRQLHFRADELLADHEMVEPLVIHGLRCHGGFDADGAYVSPRMKGRSKAIAAWQAQYRDDFGVDILDAPLDTWPESYPNVAQAKFLLREGVRGPLITTLTRIGTVEGFGALVRNVGVDDIQRFFAESVDGTCTQHLASGMFEAHARDEAGFEGVAGHREMWFGARDVAFEQPVTEDETLRMLERMGIPSGAGSLTPEQIRDAVLGARVFDDVDPWLEAMLRRMISILFIEISAFHTFAWAEELLSDPDLTAGEGEAARIVSYVRADETSHVEYLRTALSEMRVRKLIGESGKPIPGATVIDELWELGLAESLGVRREGFLRSTVAELEHALDGHPRRRDILEEFHSLGSIRPCESGEFVAVATY
jgi:hypothetical protein